MSAAAALATTTYIEALVQRLAGRGAAPVLRAGGRDIPAAALLSAIHRHARALDALGIGRGSLVALLAPNRPDALAIRYAASLVGAGSVFLSAPPAQESRAGLIAQMAPSLLVVFRDTAPLIPPGTAVPLASVGIAIDGAVRLDHLAAAQSDAPLACAARPEDLGIIVSSGGTTGVPHGSWRSFAGYGALIAAPSQPDRRQLVNGPLAYLSQTLVDATLLGGGSVVLRDGFDAADTLATIERERITHLFLVEPQLFELMDHPDLSRRDLSSLRQLVHVGASAPPVLRRRAWERLGPVIAHTYGASDMGLVSLLPPTGLDPARPESFSSAGHVLPGVTLRLRRADGGLAGVDEPGIVEIQSPTMADGYRNRAEEEAEAFGDGWFRSTDLARRDAAGALYVLGRAGDAIAVDGVTVLPTMIEETLCRLPGIRYASVVANPGTQCWVAAVVAWPACDLDPAAWRRAVADSHGDAVARAVTWLPVSRVPLTEQGKPDRAAILRLAAAA